MSQGGLWNLGTLDKVPLVLRATGPKGSGRGSPRSSLPRVWSLESQDSDEDDEVFSRPGVCQAEPSRRALDIMVQSFSQTSGSLTSSMSSTWECARNANSAALDPRKGSGWGLAGCVCFKIILDSHILVRNNREKSLYALLHFP